MNQNTRCKLCGERAKLLRKSHIIPEFMYKPLYDETRRMLIAPVNGAGGAIQFLQQGFYDKHILCDRCDNELISTLERYASALIYGGHRLEKPPSMEKVRTADGTLFIAIKNVDYHKFKLFVLSLLWRAHISQNPFFRNIDIEDHEPVIRKMLLNSIAGKRDEYPIYVAIIQNDSGENIRMLTPPNLYRAKEGRHATFVINGYIYMISLSPDPKLEVFTKPYFKETGEMDITIINGDIARMFLVSCGLNEQLVYNFLKYSNG